MSDPKSCPYCFSSDVSTADAGGNYVCKKCGAVIHYGNTTIRVIGSDANEVREVVRSAILARKRRLTVLILVVAGAVVGWIANAFQIFDFLGKR
jgi:transcription initiation factor TFIIIB Brf1 subunit/transcription initiation factor TFIIB